MADLRAQYRSLEAEINAAVLDVLGKCSYILGETVIKLEEDIAALCGAKYGIAVNSGTDAITVALAAAGIGPGDEVITTPFTFVATTESIVLVGATPVYVDIDPVTFNIDVSKIEQAITPKTKAILPVHLYGQCADMDAIMDIAGRHNLKVICDGAQAIGATYKGRGIGELGDACTLSFYPTKNLGGAGDGGMILTKSDEIAEMAKSLRDHGRSATYAYERVGFCTRLDGIQGAVLGVKLKKIKEWNESRRAHGHAYTAALAGTSITAPVEMQGNYHIYHQYTVRSGNRDNVQAALKEAGIGSAVYYPAPLHVQPAYAHLGYKEGDLPAAEQAAREVLSLPVHPELSEEQVTQIVEALKKL
jgi:dTDP-4-amino-4,6-dideoxygalactose transaminase